MRKAIDSAVNQTYPNIEVIVVNDGSTDNGKTDKIAKSYGSKIRYYIKKNGGVSSAINYGIKHMHGDFFSWLSHDDVYFPNKIKTEIDYLKNHNLLQRKVIAYSDCQVIDRRGKPISDIRIDHEIAKKHPMYAFLRCIMNGNSLLIPKKAWDDYGGLDTKLKCTQDYEKWYEMSQTYQFVHVPEVLIKSRYHSGQVTNTSPLVRTEGNALWTKVLKNYTEKERKAINGNSYTFYYYFINHLKNTPYDEALAYCEKEIKHYKKPSGKIPPETLINTIPLQKSFSNNPLIKLFQLVDREGFTNTIKHVFNKLNKTLRKKTNE